MVCRKKSKALESAATAFLASRVKPLALSLIFSVTVMSFLTAADASGKVPSQEVQKKAGTNRTAVVVKRVKRRIMMHSMSGAGDCSSSYGSGGDMLKLFV